MRRLEDIKLNAVFQEEFQKFFIEDREQLRKNPKKINP